MNTVIDDLRDIPREYMKVYDDMLIGKRERLKSGERIRMTEEEKRKQDLEYDKMARMMIRYAFKVYLADWTPEDIEIHMTKEVIKAYKIDRLCGAIIKDDGIDPSKEYWYLAMMAYPEYYDENAYIKHIFENHMKEVKKAQSKGERVPKLRKNLSVFQCKNGKTNIKKLFYYFLSHAIATKGLDSPEKLYFFFGARKGKSWLKSLGFEAYSLYFSSPLDLLHETLSRKERNTKLYRELKEKEIERS